MYSKVYSSGLTGVNAYCVCVESDLSDGLPGFSMVGYLAAEVREAQDRVKTALKNSGFRLPPKKITINLSPANIRKEGTGYDLPIAISMLTGLSLLPAVMLNESMFVGELGLNGEVKAIRGVLSIVSIAREQGLKYCFVPEDNFCEGNVIGGIRTIGVKDLKQIVSYLQHPEMIPNRGQEYKVESRTSYEIDFSQVNGQQLMKRATEIAVAGKHNILYIGPPGTGKTMIAKRIPTIMPNLSKQEQLEISKVYSICGLLSPDQPLLSHRPFRAPYQTITAQALYGGGRIPKPGELSLASKGVLFLDELSEYSKHVLELLRQPMEEHKLTISRLGGAYDFPADFFLAATMNPCSCGFYPDRNRCQCTHQQIKRFLHKISKPLLDRIDICVESTPVSFEDLQQETANETSQVIRNRIEEAMLIQQRRFADLSGHYNRDMNTDEVKEHCQLGRSEEELLKSFYRTFGLSIRSYQKVLKVARTIADLAGSKTINKIHLSEALGYRGLEEKYWGGSCDE